VVAVDPGWTTGVAFLDSGRIWTNSFRTFEDFDRIIKEGDVVVVEKPFMSSKVDPIVFEVAGACYERIWSKGATRVDQAAYVPSFVWTRHRLEGKISGNQHQKDAAAHLVFYLIQIHNWSLADILKAYLRQPPTSLSPPEKIRCM